MTDARGRLVTFKPDARLYTHPNYRASDGVSGRVTDKSEPKLGVRPLHTLQDLVVQGSQARFIRSPACTRALKHTRVDPNRLSRGKKTLNGTKELRQRTAE